MPWIALRLGTPAVAVVGALIATVAAQEVSLAPSLWDDGRRHAELGRRLRAGGDRVAHRDLAPPRRRGGRARRRRAGAHQSDEVHRYEHRVAVRLQRALLPRAAHRRPGRVELAASYRPSEQRLEVGGDWYETLALRGERSASRSATWSATGSRPPPRWAGCGPRSRRSAPTAPGPASCSSSSTATPRAPGRQVATGLLRGAGARERAAWRYASAGHPPGRSWSRSRARRRSSGTGSPRRCTTSRWRAAARRETRARARDDAAALLRRPRRAPRGGARRRAGGGSGSSRAALPGAAASRRLHPAGRRRPVGDRPLGLTTWSCVALRLQPTTPYSTRNVAGDVPRATIAPPRSRASRR